MHNDMSSPTYEEWETAGKAMLDIHFKNMEVCQWNKIGDDIKHWCLGNEGTCFRLEGVFERLYDNMFPLMYNAYETWGLIKTNDICYTDDQLIEEHAQLWGNLSAMTVVVHGMDVTWDPTTT